MTVALGAAPLGLLERRALSSAPLAVLYDLAVAMHLADAATFAAGRPLGPVAHAAITTTLRGAPPAGGSTTAHRTTGLATTNRGWCRFGGVCIAGICGTPIAAGDALQDRMLVVLRHHTDHLTRCRLQAVVAAIAASE